MEKQNLFFEETFRVWAYDSSHGQLLLRSSCFSDKRRIDILFSDVRAIEIGCLLDSISIEEVDSVFHSNPIGESKYAAEPGLKTYKITT